MYQALPSRLLACVVVLSISAAGRGEDRAVVHGPIGEAIDAYLTRLVPFGFGGAVLVERDGEVVIAKGYGTAFEAIDQPNTTETVFSLESVSKQFTAAAVMKLHTSGRLRLSDSLGDLLPGVPPDKREITVRQLLSHTSGLISGTTTVLRDPSKEGLLREVLGAPLLFEPGEGFEYSNYAFAVAAAIVEDGSGMPFDEFLERELFAPAGMTSTGRRFVRPSALRFAHRYLGGEDRGTALDRPHPDWNHIGAGGVLSTVWDMRAWGEALRQGRVLSSDAVATMLTPVHGRYAYGWSIDETERGTEIHHNGGSSEGSAAQVRFNLDTGDALIAFCNHDGERILFGDGLVKRLTEMMHGAEPPLPPAGRLVGREELSAYVGTFAAGADRVRVTEQGGMLLVSFEGQTAVDAALKLNEEEAARYVALSEASRRVLDDLERESELKPHLRDSVRRRVESGASSMGPFTGFTVMGTVPDWAWGGSDCMTIIEMRFDSGSNWCRFHWKDGELIALGGAGVTSPADVWFVADPGGADRFVGFHPPTGASPRLRFRRDGNGRVVGVSTGSFSAVSSSSGAR